MDVVGYEQQFDQVDSLLLHLKGLVLVRGLLEERGASEAELEQHSVAIAKLRTRLAAIVREGGGGAYSAAA